MTLGTKLMFAAAAAVIVTVAGALTTVHLISQKNRIESIHHEMSNILQQADVVMANMDEMHKLRVFDNTGLVESAKKEANGRPLKEVYRSTSLYKTIPVVAAWTTVQKFADDNGYDFLTPSKPGIPARNPKNDNGNLFADAFTAFSKDQPDYFNYDKKTKEIVFARPVRLTENCLVCHGDPALSPTANGMDLLGFQMENMKAHEIKGAFVLKARLTNDAVMRATMVNMSVVSAIIFVCVLAGFYVFNRQLISLPLARSISTINDASNKTANASQQIASASQSLAEGAGEQAASLEESSASLEEMASMTRRNAESSNSAKELAGQTRSAAEASVTHLQQMSTAMQEVSKIVKTIDEIAFQTNILALNAAVEAARAGEAGAGFAVVADEVRNLARRSAEAAKQTSVKIEAGVGISRQVAKTVEEILPKIRQVDDIVNQIALASTEQSQGIDQINIAVGQMDKVTQSNAASAEESASASHELSQQAQALKDAVSNLMVVVGSNLQPSGASQEEQPRKVKVSSTILPSKGAKPPKPQIPMKGKSPEALPSSGGKSPQQQIPMEGDFKDF